LTGSGGEIWSLVGAGGSSAQIRAELARRHQCSEGEIRGAVDSFLAELEREELVEDNDLAPVDRPALPGEPAASWAPPTLERYDDMRDFLLVDPIHEVDETGWPSAKGA
jgi:hypothetical protein